MKGLRVMNSQQTITQFLLQNLNKEEGTVVDLGCGKGDCLKIITEHIDHMAIGIEIFEDYIDHCHTRGLYVEKQSINNYLSEVMPSDIQCVMIDVLKHLKPKEALQAINLMKQGDRILIFSSSNKCYNNKRLEHYSTWSDKDLSELGFETMVIPNLYQDTAKDTTKKTVINMMFARWDKDNKNEGWPEFCGFIASQYSIVKGKKGIR